MKKNLSLKSLFIALSLLGTKKAYPACLYNQNQNIYNCLAAIDLTPSYLQQYPDMETAYINQLTTFLQNATTAGQLNDPVNGIDVCDKYSPNSPLIIAINGNSPRLVQVLLTAGANPTVTCGGITPLAAAQAIDAQFNQTTLTPLIQNAITNTLTAAQIAAQTSVAPVGSGPTAISTSTQAPQTPVKTIGTIALNTLNLDPTSNTAASTATTNTPTASPASDSSTFTTGTGVSATGSMPTTTPSISMPTTAVDPTINSTGTLTGTSTTTAATMATAQNLATNQPPTTTMPAATDSTMQQPAPAIDNTSTNYTATNTSANITDTSLNTTDSTTKTATKKKAAPAPKKPVVKKPIPPKPFVKKTAPKPAQKRK